MKRKLGCILLVEDKEADNFFHKMVIDQVNCATKVVIVETGEEALHYLKGQDQESYVRPDLIFLDLNMPDMNGWEFLAEYEKFPASFRQQIVTILLTVSLNPADEQKASQWTSVQEFRIKPLTRAYLKSILEKYFADFL